MFYTILKCIHTFDKEANNDTVAGQGANATINHRSNQATNIWQNCKHCKHKSRD